MTGHFLTWILFAIMLERCSWFIKIQQIKELSKTDGLGPRYKQSWYIYQRQERVKSNEAMTSLNLLIKVSTQIFLLYVFPFRSARVTSPPTAATPRCSRAWTRTRTRSCPTSRWPARRTSPSRRSTGITTGSSRKKNFQKYPRTSTPSRLDTNICDPFTSRDPFK